MWNVNEGTAGIPGDRTWGIRQFDRQDGNLMKLDSEKENAMAIYIVQRGAYIVIVIFGTRHKTHKFCGFVAFLRTVLCFEVVD